MLNNNLLLLSYECFLCMKFEQAVFMILMPFIPVLCKKKKSEKNIFLDIKIVSC